MSDKTWRLEWEGHAGQTIGAQLFRGDRRAPSIYVASSAQEAEEVLAALNAYEAHQRAAQALRKILGRAQYRVFSDEGRSAQAPGHAHEVPGVWDADNIPELAGKPCEWCSAWSEARAALAELDKVTTR